MICQFKAAQRLSSEHEAQLPNYLTATSIKVGLPQNFGEPSVQVKRMVF